MTKKSFLGYFSRFFPLFLFKGCVLALFLMFPVSVYGCAVTDGVISASCAFTKNIDGVDGGGFTVAAGVTLTIGSADHANQTIVWAPGTSIVIKDTGYIAINDGAQLKQGLIWYMDGDNDGYPINADPIVAAASPGDGRKRRVYLTCHTSFDYNDADATVYPGRACAGACSVNHVAGTCVAVAAGDHGLPVCQGCNGTSLTPVNLHNVQDSEGVNRCTANCKQCSNGNCVNQASGQDLFNHCSALGAACTNYIWGWSGNNCLKYVGPSVNDGVCNGAGACFVGVAASCYGAGAVSAGCGDAGCKRACARNSISTSYDTVAEVCWTSGQRSCAARNICGATGDCVFYAKRVFVTSIAYNGNLGGLSGGDAKCQDRADIAGLGGTWTAWLSTPTVNAKDRIAEGPYYRVDQQTKIANNKSDLLDNSLLAPISLTEHGTALFGLSWTGTHADGRATPRHCAGWTRSMGRTGHSGASWETTGQWSHSAETNCCSTWHLICFED